MKKVLFSFLLSIVTGIVLGQYNNEWIDFSKTYYKIKVAASGIYHVSKASLDAAGIGNANAESYQLWRNGAEVPLFTSTPSGPLAQNDFIEFYGEKNDGKIDRNVYRSPTFQITDKVSLFTDTAVYFLTINTSSANSRFQNISNNLSGNLPAPSPYVWANVRYDYVNSTTGRPFVSRGEAFNYGELVYSSSYDRGEMLSSDEIYANQGGADLTNRAAVFPNLLPYTAGGLNAKIRISIAGAFPATRNVRIGLNGATLADKQFSGYDTRVDSFTTVSPASLNGINTISVQNLSTNLFDRVVAGFAEIDYPRLPDAGSKNQLFFYLPATNSTTYLEIANMAAGGQAPVLYNITTGERLVTTLGNGGIVRILIPPQASTSQFLLASAVDGFRNAGTLTPRNFENYKVGGNQASYIIISNNLLLQGGASNPVYQYATYRSSAAGGGFSTRIYDVEQLADQFAFGVKMHPLSIKNFLAFARQFFSQQPRYCFLIGKGVTYDLIRENENNPKTVQLALVPTWGYPASDNLMASADLTALTATPIGRLSVVNAAEVTDYLNKVKEYEAAQASPSQTQADKAWMKDVVHVIGANDEGTANLIAPYMNLYKKTIQDTLFGGRVTTFNKFNTTTASNIENEQLNQLFQNGFSLLTYFGHSSATVLDYNLDDPNQYNNPGKYPVFLLNGCNAGNFFELDSARLQAKSTISEKYVLAKSRGGIALIASTHFGIVNGLGVYSSGFYQSVASKSYGQSLGKNIQDAIRYTYSIWGYNDYSARLHCEEETLHGDPAVQVNTFSKPDYSVEASNVVIDPGFVSIAESNFKVKVYYYNIGQAINDSIVVEVKRQYPASTINPSPVTELVYRKKVKAPLYADSLELTLPVLPERDKGVNKIIVSLDTENHISELSETNNSVSADVAIFEDDLRPVYPYNFSIVNKLGIKLVGSTGNPLSASKSFRMELDTTALFNSSFKISKDITSIGGTISFDPGITFTDSTVYYWRLAVVPVSGSPARWNQSSFVYLAGTETGYNQSHLYQHTQSIGDGISIDSSSRQWIFGSIVNSLVVNHSVYGTPGYVDDANLSIYVNSKTISQSACIGHSLIFNVFNPVTFAPLRNYPGGAYGSGLNNCAVNDLRRQYNFEWNDQTAANRKQMADFMDAVPNGAYVVVRKVLDLPYSAETFAPVMKADESIYGSANTLYTKLKNAGFALLDSFDRPRTFIFIYKKNDASFKPVWILSETENDPITLKVDAQVPDTLAYITSPLFGPAKSWKQVQWRGNTPDGKTGDVASVDVIGVNGAGIESKLFTLNATQQSFDISQVNAVTYPYLKLKMRNADSINGTAYNLKWWRIYYNPVPEGALAANILLQVKDTLQQGEPLNFKIAFKNISETAFADSIKLKVLITDKNNVTKTINLPAKKALISGDTTTVAIDLDTKTLPGLNTLYIAFNPDNDQPEQFFFNNFLYKSIYVTEDKYNPLLDVTFDGIHILNRDIVSAKPRIQVKLKDENTYLALNDTAGLVLKLKYPNENTARTYQWGTDTLRFTPANLSGGDNTATIDFAPALNQDSENSEYELTVSGKDRQGNRAGKIDYRITFQVFNKPMISNLLNFPNPFSTSTAFVFTLTGSEIPQEFKIQILTITGKIVREITRQELGDLHIGTNVTEFKWDGTDMFGQKLANGVYLYRVVTSLDGKKMDKFRLNDGLDQTAGDTTDKFFNKGYGKMVIIR
jgi:hypothetical protein